MKKNLLKIALSATIGLGTAGTHNLQAMNFLKDNPSFTKVMGTSTGLMLVGYGISKAVMYGDPQDDSSDAISYAPMKPFTEQERRAEQRKAESEWYADTLKKHNAATTLQAFLRGNKVRSNKPQVVLNDISTTPHYDVTYTTIPKPRYLISQTDGLPKPKQTLPATKTTEFDIHLDKTVVKEEITKVDFTSQRKELETLGRTTSMAHQSDALKRTVESLTHTAQTELEDEKLLLLINKESTAIQNGAFLAYDLLIEHKDLSETYKQKTIKEYLTAILELQSFFYSLCFQIRPDGIGFDEGTFHIDDPKGTLQKFLRGYLSLLEIHGYKLGDSNVGHWIGSNPFAYYRADSHDFNKAFGIDRRFDAEKECEFWFYKFSHMLCAFTPEGVWMKPEAAGCNSDQVITHAKHYGHSVWSKLKGHVPGAKNHDDDKRNNKERVPQAEKKQFKKLFPEFKGSYTIGAMYEHATKQSAQQLNNKEIQTFVTNIKKNYSHSDACYDRDTRWGNEIKLTFDELLTAYFYATQEKALIGFGNLFLDLKKNVLDFKQGNYDFAMKDLIKPNLDESFDLVTSQTDLFTCATQKQAFEKLLEQIDAFIGYEKAVRELFTISSVQNYFIATAQTLEAIKKDKQAEEILLIEPLFESDFQKNYLLSEDAKKEAHKKHEQKLQAQAQLILQEDAQKITLASDIFTILTSFCTKAESDLKDLCERNDIKPGNLTTLPSIEKIEKEIQNNQLRTLFITTIIDATTGIQKTTELRMFEYKTGNHYVPNYDFKELSKKTALVISNALEGAKTEDQKQALIDYCTKLNTTWWSTWNTICNRAEKEGYITSFSPQGKEIIKQACTTYDQKKDTLLKHYADIYEKKSNPSDAYKKIYKALIDEIIASYISTESFVKIWFFADTEELNLQNLIKGQLKNSLKAFDLKEVGQIDFLKDSVKKFLQYKETETVAQTAPEGTQPQQKQLSMFSVAYWWSSGK